MSIQIGRQCLQELVRFLFLLVFSFDLIKLIVKSAVWEYWSMIELGISMIAACLPTLRPLLKETSPRSLSKTIRAFFSLPSFSALSFLRRTSAEISSNTERVFESSSLEIAHHLPGLGVETEIHAFSSLDPNDGMHAGSIWVHRDISRSSLTK